LTLYEWLKFEDIYAELFLVKCRLEVVKETARPLGTVQPTWYKIIAGGGLILLLVFILWIPLVPFMSGSGLGTPNQPESVVLKFGIVGYVDLYMSYTPKLETDLTDMSLADFKSILLHYKDQTVFNEHMSGAQVADFVSWSEDLYSLNPVSVGRLTTALQRKLNISIYVNVKFTRPKPENVGPIFCGPD